MNSEESRKVFEEFFSELQSFYERLFPDGKPARLTLATIESLDLAPLLRAQARLDRLGLGILSEVDVQDLLLLAHFQESIMLALAPFAREDGPLATRILSLSGRGPLSAYQRATKDSQVLFGQKVIGRI